LICASASSPPSCKLRGDTDDTISVEKEISESAVTKLWRLYIETGSYTPRPNPCGRKPVLLPEQFEQIRQAIAEQPGITLGELKDEYDLPVSIAALSVTIRTKLGLGYKKNASCHRTKT
jgi:transposase